MAIFEVTSKLEKKIRLTEVQWIHIRIRHPELDNQSSRIIETLREPDFVCYCSEEENYQYYRYFVETPVSKKYLLVIANHLNEEGFVITAFFVGKIRKQDKEVVYGEENFYKL